MPGTSSREPTLYQHQTETSGAGHDFLHEDGQPVVEHRAPERRVDCGLERTHAFDYIGRVLPSCGAIWGENCEKTGDFGQLSSSPLADGLQPYAGNGVARIDE
jgi:hypothetical protein